MVRSRTVAALLAALMVVVGFAAKAATTDVTATEVDKLRKEVEDLRKEVAKSKTAPVARGSSVERALEGKYGPDATVTTRQGKLQISGLVQVWYTSYWNDHRGLFDDQKLNSVFDTNETRDNDSFRIRRTEIRFNMDIHENVQAVVMIDPAREATSFPGLPDNQATNLSIARINQVAPEFDAANGPGLGSTSSVSSVQLGSGGVPRLLQDAYIRYHGVIPHHEFQIGQFKPAVGEEGIRSSAELDFVERSLIGQMNDVRDLGATLHGTWWDERVQYWAGIFDGAGNYYGSAGQPSNRSDDNDHKDANWRLLVRPLWENECWGTLEIGGSGLYGRHGESGARNPVDNPINGLNRCSNMAFKNDAWIYYAPGSIGRGLWIRGEFLWMKDRNAPGSVVNLQGAGGGDSGMQQVDPIPFSSTGWYVAAGYRVSKSIFCDKVPGWIKPFEFALRYETMENVEYAALNNTGRTDTRSTQVFTGGVNYYIKGSNAKIQLNYNAVKEPSGVWDGGRIHEVKNNNIVVNFQVAF